MPTTTDDSIVIMPAVTCPADFPDRCDQHTAKLYDLIVSGVIPALREAKALTETFDEVLRISAREWDGSAFEALNEQTSYGAVHAMWATVAKDVMWAIGDSSDGYVPVWARRDQEVGQ